MHGKINYKTVKYSIIIISLGQLNHNNILVLFLYYNYTISPFMWLNELQCEN